MRIGLALLLCLLIAGCGSPDSKVVGEWKGEFHEKSGKTRPGANLTFTSDHRFRELYNDLEVLGSWKLDERQLSLQVETMAGKPVKDIKAAILAKPNLDEKSRTLAEHLDSPVKLTLAPDAKTMAAGMDEAAGGQTLYTKQ